jgi:hypothetical protein
MKTVTSIKFHWNDCQCIDFFRHLRDLIWRMFIWVNYNFPIVISFCQQMFQFQQLMEAPVQGQAIVNGVHQGILQHLILVQILVHLVAVVLPLLNLPHYAMSVQSLYLPLILPTAVEGVETIYLPHQHLKVLLAFPN